MDTINADQCAKLLYCTTERVEELARKGEIPGLKLGRSWVFFRADLLEFLADRARDEAAKKRAEFCQHKGGKTRRSAPPVLPVLSNR